MGDLFTRKPTPFGVGFLFELNPSFRTEEIPLSWDEITCVMKSDFVGKRTDLISSAKQISSENISDFIAHVCDFIENIIFL